MELLVGSTGFVGGNLAVAHTFGGTCHSQNVGKYYGSCPHLCIYAGVPSAMFLANKDPDADLDIMCKARDNLRKIEPKNVVLISTIAVYADSKGKYEEDTLLCPQLSPYGYNRLLLEQWVREDFPYALIIRLPALYGIGLKKNFLYDLQTITPSMLVPSKYEELALTSNLVKNAYTLSENGFYKLNSRVDGGQLKQYFQKSSFNALSFTDSRSRYQFYNLSRLWNDISLALKERLLYLNITPSPLSAADVYEAVTGAADWNNELEKVPFDYDLRSHYAEVLGGGKDYLCSAEAVLDDICRYMKPYYNGIT